jgi:hypothetical protein
MQDDQLIHQLRRLLTIETAELGPDCLGAFWLPRLSSPHFERPLQAASITRGFDVSPEAVCPLFGVLGPDFSAEACTCLLDVQFQVIGAGGEFRQATFATAHTSDQQGELATTECLVFGLGSRYNSGVVLGKAQQGFRDLVLGVGGLLVRSERQGFLVLEECLVHVQQLPRTEEDNGRARLHHVVAHCTQVVARRLAQLRQQAPRDVEEGQVDFPLVLVVVEVAVCERVCEGVCVFVCLCVLRVCVLVCVCVCVKVTCNNAV